ncbi:MAG: hypothetical protein M1503_12815 [Thaumarchaeota archaeon]|nr:hypothetical protein [Nitrososphaerota archaeon]MCL5319121.1 hypothetical protein [Nitrososphaerota archaeon]
MRKIVIFAALLVAALIGFTLSLYVITITYQSQTDYSSMSNAMRQMMGGQGGMGAQQPTSIPSYLWILPPSFIALLIVGIGGLLYFFVVPEIKVSHQPVGEPAAQLNQPPKESPKSLPGKKFSTLMNTMTPEEQKVLHVLISHSGKYLQKNIAREADLSRLKTHRIISRFSGRGIVTVRPFGNTNEVALSDWLTSED